MFGLSSGSGGSVFTVSFPWVLAFVKELLGRSLRVALAALLAFSSGIMFTSVYGCLAYLSSLVWSYVGIVNVSAMLSIFLIYLF